MDGDFDGIVMIHIEIMGQNPTSYSTESCLTSVCAAEVTRPLEWITTWFVIWYDLKTAERPSARRDS